MWPKLFPVAGFWFYWLLLILIHVFISVAFPLRLGSVPDSLISSAEGAEYGVAKFISLVRLGTNLPGPGPDE